MKNISNIEVRQAIVAHPSVLEAAVIGTPHDYWGERPTAFVTLKPDADATAEEIIAFCLERLAHNKCPVQKFVLRREPAERDSRTAAQ
jgi:fatty-acyl-CoA synthase